MGEPEVDPPSAPPSPIATRVRPLWLRGMACLAMVPLLGFIGQGGRTLWGEWASLREEQVSERDSTIVGYLNINPNPNYAATPADWSHDEGDDSLLWAGWREGEHRWFRFGRGEINVQTLSFPIGQDAIQAIDYPVYEQDGGDRWGRVPTEALVVGFGEDSASTAYPIKVLNKVQVVNELLGDRPVVVAADQEAGVSIFEATIDGRRVTMGHSGYFARKRPLLYDRGTRSLWVDGEGGLVAVAGRRKGFLLKRIAKLDVIPWGEWRSGHAEGRLLVGADRSKALPAD